MSLEDCEAQRHMGCMNAVFHIFDRHHFFQGRRSRLAAHHLPPPPGGHTGSLDTPQSNEAPHISMMKNSKPVIDKQRLSIDSPRSSIASSCNSSSLFSSSIEDTKTTHQSSETPTQQGPSEISKLVRDSFLHRDVRGITVKAASKSRGSLTYVDSPRPSLPSPKPTNNPKRLSGLRESLGALPTFHKLNNTDSGIDRSSSLLHKESPRYSYDGRESRPAVKIKELPRYSLDSKRQNCPPLDRVVPSNTNQEPSTGSHRRQSSLVAKLMGLEDLEEPENVGSVQMSDPKPTSRNSRIVQMESAPWKRQELEETQCLASQGNVYGQMEKRLAQLEFGKSGKDLRALKHILQSMQNSKRGTGTETETETCSTPCSPTIKKTCSSKNTRTPKATKKTETAKVSVSIVVPVPGRRKLDLGDKKLRGNKFFEEKRRGGAEKTKNNQHCPRKTASTRLQKKKPNLLDSPGSKNSAGKQTKNSASSKKSRSQCDQGSELSGDSRELSEQNNGISLQSDGGISMSSSQEEMEVTSEYRPKKMELVREDGSVRKRLSSTVEQLSPVSVLDPRIYEDESPSPVKMISNSFEANMFLAFEETKSNNPQNGNELLQRYISEIIFASDLFRNLDSASLILQLQQSSNLPTQNALLALQETKSNNPPKGKEIVQRRLMLDVVTEILGRKFESYDRISSNCKLETKQQVLKGLWKEIDELLCKLDEEDEDCFRSMVEKDLNGGDSVGWTDGSCDISGVAVDIERMIFRDLINEVVQARGSSYRRQLF